MRRENMDKPIQSRLRHEDDREDRELRRFIANALTAEMMNSIPGGTNSDRAKTPVDVPESERQISWNNQQEGS